MTAARPLEGRRSAKAPAIRIGLVVVVVGVVVANEMSSSLEGTQWILKSAVENGKTTTTFLGSPRIHFGSSEEFDGTDGCNSISGRYRATIGGKFVPLGWSSTLMLCNDGKGTDEMFVHLFRRTTSFKKVDGKLDLYLSAESGDRLEFESAEHRFSPKR